MGWSARAAAVDVGGGGDAYGSEGETVDVSLFSSFATNSNHFTTIPLPPSPPLPSLATEACATDVLSTDADADAGAGGG